MVRFCREHEDEVHKNILTVSLHVQPGARKTEIVGAHEDTLKVKLAAKPVDGAANDELVAYFSKFLRLPKSRLNLRMGSKSRKKVLEIYGYTLAEFVKVLLENKIITIRVEP